MSAVSKFTAASRRRVLDALRAGNYSTVAARYAGIHPRTLRRWLRRGREEKSGPFRDFHEDARRALAFAEVRAVAVLRRQMQSNWRAALEYLSRRYPSRWGKRDPSQWKAALKATRSSDLSRAYDDSQLARIGRILADAGAFEDGAPEASLPEGQ